MSSSFVWMSDIHYDPHFGTPKAFAMSTSTCSNGTTTTTSTTTAKYGCDSPWSLIQSAMASVASHNSSFVVITGDSSRHGLDQVADSVSQALLPILWNVTRELQANLSPGTIILPVLGNNDVLPDYYLDIVEDPNSSQLKLIGDTLLDLGVISEDEATLFRYGGYYARTIGNIRVRELQSYDNVYIVGHIPPTVSSYGHKDMWDEKYRLLYHEIVEMYASKIRAQLFGHFHDIEFRVVPSTTLLTFLGPAITPVYNNNPAYQVIHYQTSNGLLEDVDSYILNLSDTSATGWSKLYSTVEEYDLDDLSISSIQKGIIDPIHNQDPVVLTKFLFNYKCGVYSHYMQTCLESGVDSCSMDWYCTFTTNSSDAFNECRYGAPQHPSGGHVPDAAKIALAVVGMAALACILYLYLPCCRRRAHDYDVPDVVHVEDVQRSPTVTPTTANDNELI
ncbi:endopolyphosphatase [Fragilaria crotonensis]|nr:endopolyphosphatase [Fragilaria crotonensis]